MLWLSCKLAIVMKWKKVVDSLNMTTRYAPTLINILITIARLLLVQGAKDACLQLTAHALATREISQNPT
jgi:hypothetical protein